MQAWRKKNSCVEYVIQVLIITHCQTNTFAVCSIPFFCLICDVSQCFVISISNTQFVFSKVSQEFEAEMDNINEMNFDVLGGA